MSGFRAYRGKKCRRGKTIREIENVRKMNIVVCIKSVPGDITNIAIGEGGYRLQPAVRSYYMNETDEYALDEALVLRGKAGGNVTAITVGPISSEEKLQAAAAKGADKALRVDIASNDPETISLALAETIRQRSYDLILTGMESNDNLAAQVGIATAERLGIPFVFAATAIEFTSNNTVARVTRESGGGAQEVLEVNLPALIATQTGIQTLTYPPVAKLLMARRKGVDCLSANDLGIDKEKLQPNKGIRFLEVARPQKRHVTESMEGTAQEIAKTMMEKIRQAL
jgi:electron transfer flavoprotein beta subunit